MRWQCRYAPSLGALEDTPDNIWRTKPYLDEFQPTVFMGLYGLNDFVALWRHKGPKAIFWCGSDIRHFINGYWLEDTGRIKIDPDALAWWINENCSSFVENGIEQQALSDIGIKSEVVPSFLGKIDDYPVAYESAERPKVYLSVSGDNFEMYGWTLIEEIADQCNVDFYLYGNKKPWKSKHKNVIVRGRVEKEVMNAEVKAMQCGLRTLDFDGFSEILAKSVLWGQHPISFIDYPYIDCFRSKQELIDRLNKLHEKKLPNTKARDYYRSNLNKYPFNAAVKINFGA